MHCKHVWRFRALDRCPPAMRHCNTCAKNCVTDALSGRQAVLEYKGVRDMLRDGEQRYKYCPYCATPIPATDLEIAEWVPGAR